MPTRPRGWGRGSLLAPNRRDQREMPCAGSNRLGLVGRIAVVRCFAGCPTHWPRQPSSGAVCCRPYTAALVSSFAATSEWARGLWPPGTRRAPAVKPRALHEGAESSRYAWAARNWRAEMRRLYEAQGSGPGCRNSRPNCPDSPGSTPMPPNTRWPIWNWVRGMMLPGSRGINLTTPPRRGVSVRGRVLGLALEEAGYESLECAGRLCRRPCHRVEGGLTP